MLWIETLMLLWEPFHITEQQPIASTDIHGYDKQQPIASTDIHGYDKQQPRYKSGTEPLVSLSRRRV
jgi:hypothetical protein